MQISPVASPETEILQIRLFTQESSPETFLFFSGKKGEYWWKTNLELWVGLGEKPGTSTVQKETRKVFHRYKKDWPARICLDMSAIGKDFIDPVVNGILLGGYKHGLYKTEPSATSSFFGPDGELLLICGGETSEAEEVINRAKITAEIQLKIMDLMNAPANKKNAGTLGRWALESGDQYNYRVEVFDQAELRQRGFHALLSVNQGSEEDAALITAEYAPDRYQHTVALVGKGVTFDTGGVSIKPSNNMHLMKSDMGGAAAVLGTVELAARLQLPVRVIGIVPATENCVDGGATKPGDVINTYSGRTIEVIDTDAEGRIILADGISYAVKEFQPDVLIDLATLTGSIIQTLGYHAAGLFSSNDELAAALERAGSEADERLWRLPLWDDYKDEIQSDIADVKNFHGKPMAGAIVAAKFLEVFTENHPAWAHLDIAGTAFGDTEFFPGRAGTAYGIRLLRNYLEKLAEG